MDKLIGAVDIGGTKIAVGLVDDRGKAVARAVTPTDAASGFHAAMERVRGLLAGLKAEAGAELRGIGIGSTGPVEPETGRFGNVPFFPQWEGENPVTTLSQAFGVGAGIENDADAGALAEAAWGAARDHARVLFVTVGTGIGVGAVLDGQVYRGAGGAHPEMGHQVIDASGPLCNCGARGCWEALASGPAISDWFRNSAGDSNRPELTAAEICARAASGDERAQRAVSRAAFFLGLGLANLITVFVPDAIVLGGSVMQSATLFLPAIHETVRDTCRLVPCARTSIAVSSLGADIGLVGAAEVWRNPENRSRMEQA